MDIGFRLRKLRKDKNMSIYLLSKLAQVSQQYISKIENGKSIPSVYILEKLSKPLLITVPELLSDDMDVIYPSEYELELLKNVRKLDKSKATVLLQLAKVMGE